MMETTNSNAINVDDAKTLSKALRKLNMAQDTGSTDKLSMEDILAKMSKVKEEERKRREALIPKRYVPPGGWKKNVKDTLASSTERHQSQRKACSNPHSISQFRPKPPVWDGSFYMEKELHDTIYRTPNADPSGKQIFALTRDEPKDVVKWIPPVAHDRSIPEPPIESLTASFQEQLMRHLDKTITRVEDEYEVMPQTTDHLRNMKARVGADIQEIKLTKEKTFEAHRFSNTISSKTHH